ncbi:hypothetical protein CAEBREN_12983 [Caenorhabditis brenneri]|uniref:Uncharacterized protein n=1 Tax=Caenorhabditis brenneri TaxID=135651 RepID=G0NWG7_CAEBE|nr:hypothetical protein CAEBREN_12983 [Caenorhabditis brenneri]
MVNQRIRSSRTRDSAGSPVTKLSSTNQLLHEDKQLLFIGDVQGACNQKRQLVLAQTTTKTGRINHRSDFEMAIRFSFIKSIVISQVKPIQYHQHEKIS